MDLSDINNNIIANRWRQRYETLPNDTKVRLDKFNEMQIEEYQLKVIKRKKIYPQIGDIFAINPKEDIMLFGIVINNHINNINGDDLLLVLVFKMNSDVKEIMTRGINENDLLIPPQMVGKEYWTRGYFHITDHIDNINRDFDYGFYSIGKRKFFNEYGHELFHEPILLGTYGVATITGVGRKINQELIIAGII